MHGGEGGRSERRRAAKYLVLLFMIVAVPGSVLGAAHAPVSRVPSSAESLLGKPGGTGLIRADEIVYDTNTKVVTAKGHVEIDYNGRILLADQVTYDQNKDVAAADGHVSVLEPNGDVAFANHAVLTDKMRDGVAKGFSALLGKTGRFAAVRAVRTQNGTIVTGVRGVYSSCKV